MAILGAHMSIAGGYFKAVQAAKKVDCDCVQLFTKNNNQWKAKTITDDDASKFRDAIEEHQLKSSLSHASYLINLGSPDRELREKSIAALVIEIERANQLGIPHVVFHPGSFTTSSEEEGLENIARSLDEVHKSTAELDSHALLENTAGQGSNLGWQWEHLAYIINNVKTPELLGICIDTCHAFAAGHALATEYEYNKTMESIDEIVGLHTIKAFHLNDSKKEFGSRKDRHDNIGQGEMGIEPFEHLMNDKNFVDIPMYLETPKEEIDGENADAVNLRTLRALIK